MSHLLGKLMDLGIYMSLLKSLKHNYNKIWIHPPAFCDLV